MAKATFGGGCYWCLEAYFKLVRGVSKVTSGYSGGELDNPTAEQVYAGGSGHAEVVQLDFDPKEITYDKLLEIFFVMHNPTTLNRQGNDVGEIYRSVIYYHDSKQKSAAEKALKNAQEFWEDPIVTEIKPFSIFWAADEYMQDYFAKNPTAAYCQIIINPKVAKLRKKYSELLK